MNFVILRPINSSRPQNTHGHDARVDTSQTERADQCEFDVQQMLTGLDLRFETLPAFSY